MRRIIVGVFACLYIAIMSFKDYNSRTNRYIDPVRYSDKASQRQKNGKRRRAGYKEPVNPIFILLFDSIMPIDKYKGKKIDWIIDNDLPYLKAFEHKTYKLHPDVLKYISTLEPERE